MILKNITQIKSYSNIFFRRGLTYSPDDQFCDLKDARRIVRGLSMSAHDVSEFPYLYFTEGITGALNFILPQQPFTAKNGDYRYVFGLPGITFLEQTKMLYLSSPSSIDGNHVDLNSEFVQSFESVFLDCAYTFASNMNSQAVLPSNIKYVAFSLSKSHNLADVRVGWFLSKKKIPSLHTLQYDYDYGNSIIRKVLDNSMDREPNDLYLCNAQFLSGQYRKHRLIEGDTNLFGTDDTGLRVPYWVLD